MVASMCEEVQNPAREVPKAMVMSVVAAGFTGLLYLIPILFVLPDVQLLLKASAGQPITVLFKEVTGSAAGGFGLLFLILGIQIFAGTGALTASSRCTYAFARDGAIPGSRLWSQTNQRLGVPLWGLVLSTVVDCLLGLIYFGSTAAFNSFTGVATICLSCGYGLPILVSVLRRRELLRGSTFSLGRFGYTINVVCLIWIVLAVVLFCMPVRCVLIPFPPKIDITKLTCRTDSLPVTAETMNYASVVFAGFASISLGWYFISGRKHFRGPPVPVDVSNTVKGQSLENVDSGEADVGMPVKMGMGEKETAM